MTSIRFPRLRKWLSNFGLLWPALRKFHADNGFFLSSGITFNALINLIPLIMLLLALVGTYLYRDQDVLNHIRDYSRDMLPTLDPKIIKTIMDVVKGRRIVGFIGFVGLLWSARLVFGSVRIALNIVFQTGKKERVLRGFAVDLLMIVLVGLLLLVSMALSSVVIFLQKHAAQTPMVIGPTIQWVLKYLLPLVLSCCMFGLVYKIIPNKKVHIQSALQAAVFSSLLWEIAKHIFARHVLYLTSSSMLFGSLSTLVMFCVWSYYSSAILIIGAEFAFVLEERRPAHRRDGPLIQQ